MIDLSLDEVTANWCGYSKQKLGVPYKEYEKRTLDINGAFVNELIKFPHTIESIAKILELDLKFVEQKGYYTPSIIAYSIGFAENIVGKFSNNKLSFKFEWYNLDEKIKICNDKAKIPL